MPYFRKEDRQANRIKGITVEIGGDTTKLSDALKNVNKLLKLDPGNADLLVQKQKYLSEAISDTKEKLKQEQNALKQLQQAGQKMKDVGDKITGVGTSLSTHVTAPIAAVRGVCFFK